MIGRTISHYRIVGQLGAGGMGVVYRAEDDRLGRSVALKLLPEELAADKQAVDRLRAEARSASALNHASICSIYDVGDDEGRPYIVMELLKGQNLRDRLANGALKVHQIVDIGMHIGDALDAAHSEGIIHRDIKPANIFLTDRNQVKLLDFGIAKLTPDFASSGTTAHPDLTLAGVTLGTISYMSPEQAAGETLDGRTDLFSLGVVLYECATGRQPFIGKTSAVILANILNSAPVAPVTLNPELPVHLQDIINNCLEKDRELRYQSAADLRADLKRLRRDLESGPARAVGGLTGSETRRQTRGSSVSAAVPAVPIEPVPPAATRPQASSRKWLPVSAVVAVALIAAGVSAYWWRARTPDPAPTSAPSLTEAELETRIDQATAEIAAKLEEAKRKAEEAAAAAVSAALPPRAAAPPRSDAGRSASPRTADAAAAPTTAPAAVPAPAPPVPPPPQAAPAVEPSPVVVQRPAPPPVVVTPPEPATAPSTPTPAAAPPAAAPTSTPVPAADAKRDATASAEQDDAAIRRVVAAYARAIETKDIGLFRSVKPNLSREEQRRLEDGFRAVSKQTVNATILSIERTGQEAMVTLRRRDTIQAGARQQTTESQQMLALARAGSGWIITEIR